jgi:hypothetical protein
MAKLYYTSLDEIYGQDFNTKDFNTKENGTKENAEPNPTMKYNSPSGPSEKRIEIPQSRPQIEPSMYADYDSSRNNPRNNPRNSPRSPVGTASCENFLVHYRNCTTCQQFVNGQNADKQNADKQKIKPLFSPMAGIESGVESSIEGFGGYSMSDTGIIHSRILGDLNNIDIWLIIGFIVFTLYVITILKR